MTDKKNSSFEEFVENSVQPGASKTYDGQNLTVMQGIMKQKYDEKADRSSSIWKTIKRILIIGVIAFCFIYVLLWLVWGIYLF